MNRNTELHFGSVPKVDIKRSSFDRSCSVKTTMNVGSLIPLKVMEVLPGDTVEIDLASMVRMGTPIYPVMDNLYADYYAFFTPNRLLWSHHSAFWGENDNPWTQTTEYEIPQLQAPAGGWTEGTIADYFGIPTKTANLKVNALPFRGYARIWNDWFRDENLKANCHIYTDETTRTGVNSGDYVTATELGGLPCKVAKMHDYFTSCLPSAQKGPAVSIPLGTVAPITGTATATTTLSGGSVSTTVDGQGIKMVNTVNNQHVNPQYSMTMTNGGQTSATRLGIRGAASGQTRAEAIMTDTYTGGTTITGVVAPTNLGANVTGLAATSVLTNPTASTTVNLNNLTANLAQATAATIGALRTAFALSAYYERCGRYGTRYIEYLRGIFGVTSSDARMQRAEYLGGKRVPINMDQIIQTSATDQTSPQGNTAGFSCTIDKSSLFTKSFEEHGYLFVLVCIRPEHTYQQGLQRMWSRKKWVDFYNPVFAHLSEQPVYLKELYAQGTAADDEAFGYQEAWADYRYEPNSVTGYMRSNATGSLDVWHYADNYASRPYLSAEWIDETVENVDRTIAVTSQLTHQFIGDFYFKMKWVRPMPVYSIPKLVG